MVSDKFMVSSDAGRMAATRYVTEDFACLAKLNKRDALRLNLLVEETLGMMKSMLDDFEGDIWFVGDGNACEIHLRVKSEMDSKKKRELLSVSTDGKNAAAKGFMGMIGELLRKAATEYNAAMETSLGAIPAGIDVGVLSGPVVYDMVPLWSLQDYRTNLDDNRKSDATSEEKWENLERSIVAKIADDVVVGVKGDQAELVIAKRFGEAAHSDHPDKKVEKIVTEKLLINSVRHRVIVANEQVENFAWHAHLGAKDTMRLSLLVEETMGMLRAMAEDFEGELWLEGDNRACWIHVEAVARLDRKDKEKLIAVSSSKENAEPKGFMAKIGAIFRDSLEYTEDVYPLDVMPEYMEYGMTGMDFSTISMRRWSLNAYRDTLNREKENNDSAKNAWDDLEQSIVAKLADEVIVGIHGKKVSLTIEKKFEG